MPAENSIDELRAWWPDLGETFEDAIEVLLPLGQKRQLRVGRVALAWVCQDYAEDLADSYEWENDDEATITFQAVDSAGASVGAPLTFRTEREVTWTYAAHEVKEDGDAR